MKVIYYIGDFKAGLMDAQCQLVLGNSKILRELGYQVVLIGNDPSLAHELDAVKSLRKIDGFDCYNIRFSKSLRGFLKSSFIHKQLLEIFNLYSKPEMIICYGSLAFAIENYKIGKWCKKNKVLIVSNCVDLSSHAHGTIIERIVKSLDSKLKHRFNYKKTDGIIAVSEYIEAHFNRNKDKSTVIVPPLKDTSKFVEPVINQENHKVLVYIGVPFPVDGRSVDESAYKDRIDIFIDLLCKIRGQIPAFRFDIYGLTKEQYLHVVYRQAQLIEKNNDIIKFHGRIEHEHALEVVRQADFSVLYRTRNQMTMAGFSSKLVESISIGTPMILTDTSDYHRYLEDGETCFFLDDHLNETCIHSLVNALSISKEDIFKMKMNCYHSKIFDYHKYVDALDKFIKELKHI